VEVAVADEDVVLLAEEEIREVVATVGACVDLARLLKVDA
jgi:hypothetical protein